MVLLIINKCYISTLFIITLSNLLLKIMIEQLDSLQDNILDAADKLKGNDYGPLLKEALKDVEKPEEVDIIRSCQLILQYYEEKYKTDLGSNIPGLPNTLGYPNNDIWLTRKEAAKVLNISESTFKRRKIKGYKSGRITRYKASDIQGILQTILGSATSTICKETVIYFDTKRFRLLPFIKGHSYEIIYENSIYYYVYNKDYMDSMRLSKKQFSKNFSLKGELEYDAAQYGGLL